MNKTKNINIRCNDEEKKLIEAKAKSLGLNISSFIRMVVLKDLKEKS